MPATEAQKRAAKKWRENHPEQWKKTSDKNKLNWLKNNFEEWRIKNNEYQRVYRNRYNAWRRIKMEFLCILLE